MNLVFILLTVLGLSLFEIITSIDNAIINAEVLSTMQKKAQKWFLTWGIFFAVFVTRGLLPLIIVWLATPGITPLQVLTAVFNSDPNVAKSVEEAAPVLLITGGIFMVFLFFNWLFIEPKNYGLAGERFFHSQGVWFYAIISIILTATVWLALKIDPVLALGAVIGSTAFFITHGFKQYAQEQEKKLVGKNGLSDISKILYLEVIDTSFSIDGVIGAFAFTLAVPLIFLGNGIGAIILRNFTVHNITKIKKYKYLKNGAMYSILFLGIIMLSDSFGAHIPEWISPIITFGTVGYFFYKSKIELQNNT